MPSSFAEWAEADELAGEEQKLRLLILWSKPLQPSTHPAYQ